MQLRGVSQDRSCRPWLAMSRTADLIHRAKRARLRGSQGGGGGGAVVWSLAWSRPWLWVLLWRCCVLEGGPRLPQPHVLSYSFLFCSGGRRIPHALGRWDPLTHTPAFPPNLGSSFSVS